MSFPPPTNNNTDVANDIGEQDNVIDDDFEVIRRVESLGVDESHLGSITSSYDSSSVDMSHMTKTAERLEKTLRKLEDFALLAEQMKISSIESAELKSAMESLTGENSILRQKFHEMEKEVEFLTAENSSLRQKCEETEKEILQKSNTIDDLKNKLSEEFALRVDDHERRIFLEFQMQYLRQFESIPPDMEYKSEFVRLKFDEQDKEFFRIGMLFFAVAVLTSLAVAGILWWFKIRILLVS